MFNLGSHLLYLKGNILILWLYLFLVLELKKLVIEEVHNHLLAQLSFSIWFIMALVVPARKNLKTEN